jgi:hypothetical protein
MFEGTNPAQLPATIRDGGIIKIYYVKDINWTKELSYVVEYYLDGELYETLPAVTENVWINAPDELAVQTMDLGNDRYTGYMFDSTDPAQLPAMIRDGGIIKVYYIKDDTAVSDDRDDGDDGDDGDVNGDTGGDDDGDTGGGGTGDINDGEGDKTNDGDKTGDDDDIVNDSDINTGDDGDGADGDNTGDSGGNPGNGGNDVGGGPGDNADANNADDSNIVENNPVAGDGRASGQFILQNAINPLGTPFISSGNFDFDENFIPLAFVTNHIQYLYGYPEGDVRPERGITRAEAASIFHRLLANEDKDVFVETSFNDVSADAWYYQAVAYLHKHGIVSGYSDGGFRPDAPITRAEYATIASKFDELENVDGNIFNDVGDDHWAVAYINSAAAKGWVSGFGDGTFKPEDIITRVQVVTIVNRMLGRKIEPDDIPDGVIQYTDLDSGHWAYTDIIEASHTHTYDINDNGSEIWKEFQASKI